MGAAGDVEQQAVVAVDRAPGREPIAPERQPLELPPVRRRVGPGRDEAGEQGAGVGEAHATAQPLGPGPAVDRRQHRPAAVRRDQSEGRRLSRPRGIGTGAGP